MKLKTCRKKKAVAYRDLRIRGAWKVSIMYDTETLPENCVYSVLLGIYEGRKVSTGRG
jgi:hypothetical protein